MERPKEEKGFEVGEIGGEILNEWYAEREPVAVEPEREETKEVPLPKPPVETKDVKSEEELKRETIKVRVKELLDIGEKKGLIHAIEKAKRSDDPFLLDVFHDILAKDGNYKNILKK